MATDPRRALIVVVCVLAVAIGGVALPATSYGDVPGSDVDVAGSSDSAGVGGLPDVLVDLGSEGSTTGDEKSTPTPTDDAPADDTPTPTDSPTPTSSSEDDESFLGSLGSLGGGLVVLFLLVCFVVPVVIISRGGSGWDGPGSARLERLGDRLGLSDIPNPFRAIAARTTAVTLSAPSTAGRLGHALQEAVVGTGSALGSAAGALGRAGRMQASALGALASAVGGVGFGLSTSLSDLMPRFGREDLREARPAVSGSAEDASGEEGSRLSVGEAWAEMRRLVSIPNASARTPAEVARAAVDQGLPRGPVMRLTETFREVTYGRADPNGIRETAVEALGSLRDAIRGED